jgi:hypothetical protein
MQFYDLSMSCVTTTQVGRIYQYCVIETSPICSLADVTNQLPNCGKYFNCSSPDRYPYEGSHDGGSTS